MPIYTKTGDRGETSLLTGKRVSKTNPRVEAYGTIDELNSIIGAVIAQTRKSEIREELINIQKDLFVIGAVLSNPSSKGETNLKKRIHDLENVIDRMTAKLPRLFNFILPGGGRAGAFLHIARTVARRAERRTVFLSQKEPVKEDILIYINRLSDLFLTMARFVNYKENKKEIIWKRSE